MDGNGFTNGNDNSNLFGNPVGMNTSVPGMNSFTTDMTGSTVGMGSMSGQPAMDFGQPATPLTMQPEAIQASAVNDGATPVGATQTASTPVGATQVAATQVGATQVATSSVGTTPVGASSVAQQPVSGAAGQAAQYYQPAASAQLNNAMPMQGMPMQGMPMAGMGMPMQGMGVQMGNQPLSGPIYDVSPSETPKNLIKPGSMFGEIGTILFGVPFVLAGVFAFTMMHGNEIEGMNGTSATLFTILFPLIFVGAGLAVMIGGVSSIIKAIKVNKRFRQITSYGKALDARAANVDIVSNVRVNGNTKQALVCLWSDPETGALHTFTSQADYRNKFYLVGQPLRVYVNPGNLEEYIVDTSKVSYAAAVKYAADTVMNRVR